MAIASSGVQRSSTDIVFFVLSVPLCIQYIQFFNTPDVLANKLSEAIKHLKKIICLGNEKRNFG